MSGQYMRKNADESYIPYDFRVCKDCTVHSLQL